MVEFRSEQLGLSKKYDWSNPEIPEDVLVLRVLMDAYFEDVVICCMAFGIDRVQQICETLDNPHAKRLSLRAIAVYSEVVNEIAH